MHEVCVLLSIEEISNDVTNLLTTERLTSRHPLTSKWAESALANKHTFLNKPARMCKYDCNVNNNDNNSYIALYSVKNK